VGGELSVTPMRTDTSMCNDSLTCGLDVFDFLDLNELGLAAGIDSTQEVRDI